MRARQRNWTRLEKRKGSATPPTPYSVDVARAKGSRFLAALSSSWPFRFSARGNIATFSSCLRPTGARRGRSHRVPQARRRMTALAFFWCHNATTLFSKLRMPCFLTVRAEPRRTSRTSVNITFALKAGPAELDHDCLAAYDVGADCWSAALGGRSALDLASISAWMLAEIVMPVRRPGEPTGWPKDVTIGISPAQTSRAA